MQISTVAALLRLGTSDGGDWETILQEILRVSSDVLDIERASYWRFRKDPPSMVCELRYVTAAKSFERGFVLEEKVARPYFEAIRKGPLLVMEDVRKDPSAELLAGYREAHGIRALLDVPITVAGEVQGFLCLEETSGPRSFSDQDREFAVAVGQIISARLEARARTAAEEGERRAVLLGDVVASMEETFDLAKAAKLAVERALPTLADVAALATFDRGVLEYLASASVADEGRAVFDELARRYPPRLDGPGVAPYAVRERESVLVPIVTSESVRAFDIDDDHFALLSRLKQRSVMAVPLRVRGEVTGSMMFGSSTRSYGQADLRFAEKYAQRIGLVLENARLYQQVRESVRVRDEFVSLASHELRTPITVLRLAAQTLRERAGRLAPAAATALIDRIVRHVDRLDSLAGRLLDVSAIDTGQLQLQRTREDLAEIVRDVARSLEETMARAGCELRLSADGPVWAALDPVRITQVVSNLLDNAVKFGAGKPIEVTVTGEPATAILRVRDHGAGIPEKEQAGIFERYKRLLPARNFSGLGLGLFVVEEIVQAHGGTVEVNSRPGEGAEFTVKLPRVSDAG